MRCRKAAGVAQRRKPAATIRPLAAGDAPEGPRRERADLEIPARLLRQGVNLLAVEVVRAPYDKNAR